MTESQLKKIKRRLVDFIHKSSDANLLTKILELCRSSQEWEQYKHR